MSNISKSNSPELFRSISQIARQIQTVESRIQNMERTSQSKNRSVTNGSTIYYGLDGQPMLIVGKQWDGNVTVLHTSGTAPSAPTAPVLSTAPGAIIGVWDGKFLSGITPTDYDYIQVHASLDPLAVPDDNPATVVQTINSVTSVNFTVQAIDRAYTEHRIWLVAKSRSGALSEASDPVNATPDYVQPADILPEYVETVQQQLDDHSTALSFIQASTRTFRGSDEPTEAVYGTFHSGDTWFETTDDGTVVNTHTWNIDDSAWEILGLPSIADVPTIFYQTTAPVDAQYGDMWVDDNGHPHYCITTGSSDTTPAVWQSIQDQDAIALASGEAITAAAIDATAKAASAILAAAEYTDDSLSVITGSTFQTSALANRGIKITSGGLVAYTDGSISGFPAGTAMLAIVGSSGAISMIGDLTSGSTITGARVTGGLLQTESTTDRGIKISSAGMTGYDNTGNVTFNYNSATGGLLFTGPAVTNATVTGGVIQTNSAPVSGIKLTSTGLAAYADGSVSGISAGTATFLVNATTGALNLTGPVLAGGDISGATVTGGTVQTSSSPNVGVKFNSNGLSAYGADGSPTLVIDGLTGSVTLKGNIQSGSTITGASLSIGTISIDSTNGFVMPGRLSLPIDASQPASFNGSVVASSLTVLKDMALLGTTNQIKGTISIASGITAPTVPASLGQCWQQAGTSASMPFGPVYYGLTNHVSDSNLLVTAVALFGGNLTAINKTTGQLTPFYIGNAAWGATGPHGFNPVGGVTQIGSYYYVLGQDSARDSTGTGFYSDWYIYRIDSTGVKQAELFVANGSPSGGILGRPGIGRDESGNVLLSCAVGSSTLRIAFWNAATFAAVTFRDYATFSGLGNNPVCSVYEGSFDFGATRDVFCLENNNNFVTNTSGSRLSDTYSFARANLGTTRGLHWDGTRFWAFNTDGALYKHGTNVTARNIYATYSWYDGDTTGGSATHETPPSPVGTYAQWARTYATVTTPPAPDTGITDPSRTDKANRVGIYMAAGTSSTTRYLQSYLSVAGGLDAFGAVASGASGDTITTYATESIATGTSTEQVTNGFAGAVNSPGVLQSFGATVGGGSGMYIQGDGSGQINGVRWDANGTFLTDKWSVTDSGWLNLTPASGWDNAGFGWQTLQYKRLGKIVFVRGLVVALSTSGTSATIATLPSGYRPTTTQLLGSLWSTGSAFSANQVAVASDGSIQTAVSIPAGNYTYLFGEIHID